MLKQRMMGGWLAAVCLLTVVAAVSPAEAYVFSTVKLDQIFDWPVTITYSYSNLLDGGMQVPSSQLRAAVEEGMGLWASYAPLHFVEVPDSGPLPDADDTPYPMGDTPRIRIGHHYIDGDVRPNVIAHAFYPYHTGLGADIHFDNSNSWSVGPDPDRQLDLLYTFVHELGHVLGLDHEPAPEDGGQQAIMNAMYPLGNEVYSGLGTAFLFPDDIAGIQSIYSAGTGSVTPLPEPASMALLAVGSFVLLRSRCHKASR